VLTDSGGLQKEAFFLGRHCVILRDETEWLETLRNDMNSIAGNDGAGLLSALERLFERQPPGPQRPRLGETGPFGDGHAAQRIVEGIGRLCEMKT